MSNIQYYQTWYSYGAAAGHMLRFYFKKPDATIDQMSPATQKAWIACNRAVSKLLPSELEEVRAFFSRTDRAGCPAPGTIVLIDKVRRLVAIERGLADDR